MFRLAEAGKVHFTETSDGQLLICLDSLSQPANGLPRLAAGSIEDNE
jgi:hypothetical protein